MARRRLRQALFWLAAASFVAPLHADNPIARGRALSPVDCPAAGDMVVEFAPAPTDRTYMRVQHMGDPGADELDQEVAHVVTWDVGSVTGMELPPEAQRGFRNEALPVGTSAFQLACGGGGFLINTFQFSHHAPLVGEGPNVSVARDFATALPAFRNGASLVIEGTLRVPWRYNQRTPVIDAGTAQVSFFYYAQDSRSGTVVAHVLGAFDNRTAQAAGGETWGSDGHVAFISSPIAAVDGAGNPVRFLSYSGVGAAMQYEQPWREPRRFIARITNDNFRAALELLRAGPLPNISPDPADYRILSFGVLGEVFPGTGDSDNVSLGASVTDLALREVPLAGPLGGAVARRP